MQTQEALERAVPEEALELFAAPLDEFTERRNALVKALKKEGNDETAAAVKALRKPKTSAWVVNQLAREHRDDVQELVRLTEALRLSDSAEEFRSLAAQRHEVVERLVEAAPAVAEARDTDMTPAVLHEVGQTLRATTTPEQLDALTAGVLLAPYEASGFGAFGELWEVDEEASPEKPDKELEELEERLDDARSELEDKRRAAEKAERRLLETREDLATAERAVERLQDRIDKKKSGKRR